MSFNPFLERNTMADQKDSNLVFEKINPDRVKDIHEAFVECGQELYAQGMIPKPEFSINEMKNNMKIILEQWEKGDTYLFHMIDVKTNQFIGNTILNHVNRNYQMANLAYWVRTSRVGEGIATEGARFVARYGFEKLGFQRIEIVVSKDNQPSLRVAEKLGAVREGLLRNRLLVLGSPCDAYMHSLIPKDFGITNIT